MSAKSEKKDRCAWAAVCCGAGAWLLLLPVPVWWAGLGCAAAAVLAGSASTRHAEPGSQRAGIFAILMAAGAAAVSVLWTRGI